MTGDDADHRTRRPAGRTSFAAQVLVLQLIVVTAVVVVCTGAYAWVSSGRLVHEAQSTALAIAQSVASDPDVRTAVTLEARTPGRPDTGTCWTGRCRRSPAPSRPAPERCSSSSPMNAGSASPTRIPTSSVVR